MEGSEQFATLEDALRTNLILFDYGRVLGTQIEDVFDSTIQRVLNYAELTQEILKAQGRWDSFRDGLRLLIIPPGRVSKAAYDGAAVSSPSRHLAEQVQVISRLDLHRHAQLFEGWVGNINTYLRVYGAGRVLSRCGVISNFEAAGRPWMLRLLRQHHAGLIDEDLVTITGEEGVVKGDGPGVFEKALRSFRRRFGEPVSPVFVDDQVDRYVPNAGRAGIRAFVHYGFAGADTKARGGFYGREFETATLHPSAANGVPLFRSLLQKSGV